jgi:glutathione S-transferase
MEAMYKAEWGETEVEKEEGKNQEAAAVMALEEALRECSMPFFGGKNAGFVDVVLGSLLPWAHAVRGGVETFDSDRTPLMASVRTPLLAAWTDSFGELDAVQAIMPGAMKAVGFAMATSRRRAGRQKLVAYASIWVIWMISVACILYVSWMAS